MNPNLKRLIDTQRMINKRDINKGIPGLRKTIRHLETQGENELISLFTALPAYSEEVTD